MTPKEKYQDIDASASVLPEKALIALKELKPVLFDKKYQAEEYAAQRKKAEEKMDILYSKISKDYPDAIKSKVAKQPEPKTPQAMAQKAAKQTIKQPTVKNPKATAGANNRGNVTKLAKEIRKDGETWHAAMKRAGEMINKEKGKAVKKANVQYEKLKAFLAKNPSIEKTMVTYGKKPNQGTRPLDVKRDAARVAKPKGKRVSSEGKTYYEYRANRTDSSRKHYPYLELGGKLFGAGYFAKGGNTKSTGIGRIEPQRNINSTELFDLRYGDVFEITKKDHTASSEYYIFLEFSDKHDVSIKAIRFPELKGEFGNKETYINGVSDGDIRILSREEAGKMLLEYNINHKKFAHGGEFGHTYNGAGKFSEGGYMATGEDYEYYNKFGLEQSDFEKIVEVWHMHEKTPTVEVEKQYNMVLDAMEDKYGETKIDDVVDDIYHRHGLMKIMNYAKGGKTKSKTYKVKIYSTDYRNTLIMEKTFTNEKAAVYFAYSVDDMNDDGFYYNVYGLDANGKKLIKIYGLYEYQDDDSDEVADEDYIKKLPKYKDCVMWQVDMRVASFPTNKTIMTKTFDTLRKAVKLVDTLENEPLSATINNLYYDEYEHNYFAKGGKTNNGNNLPNTVEEYFAAMNDFSMKLGEAEANFANDNGASYQKLLAERDEFFEKTKAKWYAELNEAEGNFAKDGGKSYEAALKKLDDARLRFAKGGTTKGHTKYVVRQDIIDAGESVPVGNTYVSSGVYEGRYNNDGSFEIKHNGKWHEAESIDWETYAKGGKVKSRLSDTHKYVPNRMIQEIEVERKGKTTFIDGADILDGVYVKKGVKFAHGGTMPHVHSKKHRNG